MCRMCTVLIVAVVALLDGCSRQTDSMAERNYAIVKTFFATDRNITEKTKPDDCEDLLYPRITAFPGISIGRPLMYPGKLALRAQDGKRAEIESLLEQYGLQIDFSSGDFLIVEVEAGHENAWETIFSGINDISLVCRWPISIASVDAFDAYAPAIATNSRHKSPFASDSIVVESDSTPKEIASQFIEETFSKKGLVTIEKENDLRIKVNISQLRSEVLSGLGYWERITINLIFAPTQQSVSVFLIIDGYYAGGIGDKLPEETAFSDMDHNYYAQLERYANSFLAALKKKLIAKTA